MIIIFVLVAMLVAFYMVLTSSKANAQSGFYQGGESFSVGQTFYGDEDMITEGMMASVAVPDTVADSTKTAIDDYLLEGLKVYPNPFTTYLKIESPHYLQYELYDITGKILQRGDTDKQPDVTNLVPAPYFLKVREDKTTIKVLKLIKR